MDVLLPVGRRLVSAADRQGHLVVVDCELVDAEEDPEGYRYQTELVGHQLVAVQ
jgi:hypothetical protein